MFTLPPLGLGTYNLKGESAAPIAEALKLGFRHIDTAQFYENEADVGRIVKDSGIPRSDIFITTKIWPNNLSKENLIPSLEESLKKLQIETADLVLVHWPPPNDQVPLTDIFEELLRAKAAGKCRFIGVSNFTVRHLKEAIGLVGASEITTNQIEVHPYLQNRTVRQFCREMGVGVTAYMPLARGKVAADETLKAIGKKHGISAAQVALSWILGEGMSAVPLSRKKEHLKENLNVPTGILTGEDIKAIEALECNGRIVNIKISPVWDQ